MRKRTLRERLAQCAAREESGCPALSVTGAPVCLSPDAAARVLALLAAARKLHEATGLDAEDGGIGSDNFHARRDDLLNALWAIEAAP